LLRNIVTLSNSMCSPDGLQRTIFLFKIVRGLRARAITWLSDSASNPSEGCIVIVCDGVIALGGAQLSKKGSATSIGAGGPRMAA
jgi:hypothetical protein